jgi:hypothetical protein
MGTDDDAVFSCNQQQTDYRQSNINGIISDYSQENSDENIPQQHPTTTAQTLPAATTTDAMMKDNDNNNNGRGIPMGSPSLNCANVSLLL